MSYAMTYKIVIMCVLKVNTFDIISKHSSNEYIYAGRPVSVFSVFSIWLIVCENKTKQNHLEVTFECHYSVLSKSLLPTIYVVVRRIIS